ncbi:UDP-2,4-diacetamido-2,4,6-trideoxy-beta-L-altropyranose hydrolase [Colwellia sp. 75C3]|uniref:UDP-2,4-diacetamido-2,4, 6-trideoxy-beta-L-altropyranose hydrolase n=1 Tax=Colwellia sp. 75C3 TaxID=888425 RepID=UPI000C32055E|nr:UDP-2,4-diacetamido-2,4,6-trideoxy-beta-L-altropyranose hydrolase [Colwellia sp. 75C3]PKG81129.1 UDP-2,4-diacetamido-2,4,6-trideoxy-beta-L-altropyranose hydrolase [Colwellia sp. 75C3]
MKNVIIRADSSSRIGVGHIMRCLTLAHKLVQANYNVSFLCKEHKGNINQEIITQGFNVICLSPPNKLADKIDDTRWLGVTQDKDAVECINKLEYMEYELLIVDHYSLDKIWHLQLSPYAHKLIVIDDLANRQYHCDALIDPTISRQKSDYYNLVPKHCQLLLGKSYMLLREEFSLAREQAIKKRQNTIKPSHVLITLGGTDPDNITQTLLAWLIEIEKVLTELSITVVISEQSRYKESIEALIKGHDWINLSIKPKSMAALMILADIAIGTSGGTAWERCCLGIPTINIISAQNQQVNSVALNQVNAIINLGWYESITKTMLADAILLLINSPKNYQALVKNSLLCCDGKGAKLAAKRIIRLGNTHEN